MSRPGLRETACPAAPCKFPTQCCPGSSAGRKQLFPPLAEPTLSALGWGPQGLRMKLRMQLSPPPHWALSCLLLVSWG